MKNIKTDKLVFLAAMLSIFFIGTAVFTGSILENQTVSIFNTYSWGSSGSVVTQIQEKLIRWGYMEGSADGVYGYKTWTAVKSFQKKNGLTADGIVGTSTLQALGINTGSSSSTTGSHESDVRILAAAIYGESRGEPYEGQVAVGAVILNRVKHPSFPNTISGVIYQPGAFDAVTDGQINLTPNETAIKAARDAMNGWDPTDGAIYYWNPATATSKWIWSVPITKQIGKHVFGTK